MSAGSYRWVQTDRRTDAEILREIAECDTPTMILSRDRVEAYEEHVITTQQQLSCCRILLLATPREDVSRHRLAIAGWSEKLASLVLPPGLHFVLLDLAWNSSRKRAAMESNTLWDWLIRRQTEGTDVFSVVMEADRNFRRPLSDLTARKLVPKSTGLSNILRDRIRDLAGMESSAANPDVTALRAGLFQWHDALDESHECSQAIEGKGRHQAGDYWHAIMHRRESDYGNSKYWFRQLGPQHPVFPELGRQAEPLIAAAAPEWKDRLLRGGWDPFAFVDLCEAAADGKHSEWESLAESIQELEMLLLLASTYRDATA